MTSVVAAGEVEGALVLASSVCLAVVFAVAGCAKVADRRGTRNAVRELGVPDPVGGIVAASLAPVELALAALLVVPATRWWAAVAALGLLGLFCCVVGVALARGRRPECHCFGQLQARPIGWGTLARNGLLAVPALVVVAAGPSVPTPGATGWLSRVGPGEWLVLGLAVVIVALLVAGGYAIAHVLRRYGEVLLRLEAVERRLREAGLVLEEGNAERGLPPGTAAPDFWLPSVDGGRVALGDLLAPGRPVLLVFTSPTCGPCSLLLPDLARWQREHADVLTIALLSHGEPAEIRAEAEQHAVQHVLVDDVLAAYEAYEANGTPSAVLVAPDGTIGSWLAAGSEWVELLVHEALGGGEGRGSVLPVGSELPAARVVTLAGDETDLRETIAEPTAILFWNPRCGYCRSLHADVRAWEHERPQGAPRLVIVSAGTVEELRAEGFSSTVVLDPAWALSTAVGAHGTPMALLVDADLRVTSPLATGAAAVLDLLAPGRRALAG